MAEPIGMLLAKARSLRAERDRYLAEAPGILRALRDADVPLSRIEAETGIPEATAVRLSGRASPTPDRST